MSIQKYILMHKDVEVIGCKFEDEYFSGFYAGFDLSHLPFGVKDKFGRCNYKLFSEWLRRRSVPFHRINIHEILGVFDDLTIEKLALQNLMRNLSDCYWLKPDGSDLTWSSVNFFDNDFSDSCTRLFLGDDFGVLDANEVITPDACTGGCKIKGWRIIDGGRYMAKRGGKYLQEAYNEVFGSKISKILGLNSVKYIVAPDGSEPYALCPCICGSDVEMISAYSVLREYSVDSMDPVDSVYKYIDVLKSHGISSADEDIGKMCVVDYILKNEDRHWSNFGILRNPDTLEWLSVIPLFDFEDSLCSSSGVLRSDDIYGRFTGQLLSRDVLSFYHGSLSQDVLNDVIACAEDVFLKADGLSDSRRYQIVDVVKDGVSILSKLAE